jgi:hypothetical protein
MQHRQDLYMVVKKYMNKNVMVKAFNVLSEID